MTEIKEEDDDEDHYPEKEDDEIKEVDHYPEKEDDEIVTSLRVNLKKRLANDLEFVKLNHGFLLNSDIIRFLITKEKKNIKMADLPGDLKDKLINILQEGS